MVWFLCFKKLYYWLRYTHTKLQCVILGIQTKNSHQTYCRNLVLLDHVELRWRGGLTCSCQYGGGDATLLILVDVKEIKTFSYQATVPAAKFTKFCATCIAILFGSKTPVYTVAGSTFDLFSIGCPEIVMKKTQEQSRKRYAWEQKFIFYF